MRRTKLLWVKLRVACVLAILALMALQTGVPVEANTTLDTANPNANFTNEGGQSFTPGTIRKSRGSIDLTRSEFKSITTRIGLNFMKFNNLYPTTNKTLGQ